MRQDITVGGGRPLSATTDVANALTNHDTVTASAVGTELHKHVSSPRAKDVFTRRSITNSV